MELVLVRFEIAELAEPLIAIVQQTGEGLLARVYDLVSADVAVLSEALATEIADVWPGKDCHQQTMVVVRAQGERKLTVHQCDVVRVS